MKLYAHNFQRIDRLLNGELISFAMSATEPVVLKSPGFQDLIIERIGENLISLVQYYKEDGDIVPDPDMAILIRPDLRMVEALYLQNAYGFRRAYRDADRKLVYPTIKKELNEFLAEWLRTLRVQGFYPTGKRKGDS